MAEEDAVIAKYFVKICVILLLIILMWKFRYIYSKVRNKLYARLLHKFSKYASKATIKQKEKLFADLHRHDGPITILEIGAGTGNNFEFFPPKCHVICVDPNSEMQSYLKANIDRFPHVAKVDYVEARAEDMSKLESNSVDAVVTTLVLCAVYDIAAALREIRRILKPVCILLHFNRLILKYGANVCEEFKNNKNTIAE